MHAYLILRKKGMTESTGHVNIFVTAAGWSSSKQSGFTLFEIILVFFIMSLIILLSAVYYANTLPAAKLDAATRELASTIRHARSLATANNETKGVTIDLDLKKFNIDGLTVRDIPPEIGIKVIDRFLGEILHGKHRLIFHAGRSVEGSMLVLWSGKRSQGILLDPVVGAVKIKKE